jgi:putative membrane protein
MNFRKLLIRLIINALALVITATVLPGIVVTDALLPLLGVALIFSIVNALVKPILMLLTCPAVILTLGLFILVINGLILQLTAYFAGDWFNVVGFGAAFFGGIILALVNMVLEGLIGADDEKPSKKTKRE